jgi:hypothetical protein
MSDVTVAPNAAPPSAPAANETVINQNPVSAPNPVGSQAPDKPVGDIKGSEHRPQSRREAIQKAFEKARAENPPQAAKPRIGHNNPPEETPKDKAAAAKPKLETVDLKKRPQPVRGEQGRFARAEPEGQDDAQPTHQQQAARQQGQAQHAGQQQVQRLPEGTPYRDPPQRMTEKAKTEWSTTPESVRAEVHRMHSEFDAGFKRYRGDHETMTTIRPFETMAKQQGTTLHRALSNYVSMEQKLRSDVVGGLDIIVSNLNLRTPDGQKLTLADIAHHVLSRSPDQHKLMQAQNAQAAQSQQIGQLHQMVRELAKATNQMQYERQFTNTRSQLDRYADDGAHPRFDELSDLILQEINAGHDLETAYQRANLLRPATAAQTRTNAHGNNNGAAQSRPVDKSISGAPSAASSNGARQTKGKPVGRREAIASAIKRVNGSL